MTVLRDAALSAVALALAACNSEAPFPFIPLDTDPSDVDRP